MKIKSFLYNILKHRATPYLALIIIIAVLILITRFTQYYDWGNNLLVEMIGALLLLGSFDLLQSWRKEQQETQERNKLERAEKREKLRLKKSRESEANYRLKIAYELISPYAIKYRDYTRAITTDFFDNSIRYPAEFEFKDLIHLYDRISFPDTPINQRAYHQYFACLFRLLDEVNRAIFHLNPTYHFDIIELYKNFSQKNEEAYRLYSYFQSIENEQRGIDSFVDEMYKVFKANKESDPEYLKTLPNTLKPYVRLYHLTIANNKFLIEQGERILESLKQHKDRKTGHLKFKLE